MHSLPHEFNGFHVNREGVVHASMMLPQGAGLASVCGNINNWSNMTMVNPTPVGGTLCKTCEQRLPQFAVREYRSHFQVIEIMTGRSHPMGDGVDTLFDGDKAISPGEEGFRKLWEESLNRDATSTQEAYFPK